MSRKNQSITLSVSPEDKAALEAIALKFGITWGDRPNVSKLVEAIAKGTLKVDWADEMPAQEQSLHRRKRTEAAITLIKQGLDKLLLALD